MATTIRLKGYFGVKEAFNVTSSAITTGWTAGQLFQFAGSTASYITDYVVKASVAGWPVAGVALETSTEYNSANYGMTSPSGSKVTLVHGHCRFEIPYDGTTKVYETGVESARVNNLLFASTAGKWTIASGSAVTSTDAGRFSHPIGMLSKVPSAANNYTLGVVLFG